jgi:DNA-binding transcriptional ArsR family regulator
VPVPLYQAKAEFFRTLGHPARIRVLELLSERNHSVHELLEHIDIEASNLSQQLAVLRRAGLVVPHRTGHAVVYSIAVPEVRDLLLAARRILRGMLDDQQVLRAELDAEGDGGPAAGPDAGPDAGHDAGGRALEVAR